MKVSDALSRNAIEIEDDSEFREVEEAAKAFAVVQGDGMESITLPSLIVGGSNR